jgi:ABC-2 type transport system permease protein
MNGSKNKASFRRIKALVVKEFYQVIRDPSSMMISIILPLVLLFIYGYGISLDMEHLKLGCLMEDRTPLAQSFAQSMTDTPFFEVKFEQNPTELTKNLVAGNTLGAVIIPSYFSDFSENAQKRGPIFVVADGSQPNSANFVQNYVMGAWENWQQQERISKGESPPPLAYIQSRFWYNEELNSHHFLIPGSIAIIMALIGTLLTALVIAREWERGTMEALMATPVTIFEIILGKLIPYFCLGLVSMVICTLVACFLFEVPLRGAFLVLTMVTIAFLIPSLGMGLLISSVARNQFTAAQIALVSAFLPAFILSGFIFEISSMPPWIQTVTRLLPARYFVSCLQTIFLVGNVWSLVLYNFFAMLFFGIVIFTIMRFKLVKRLD